MTAAARRLGEFAAEFRAADIPSSVLEIEALHALDTIGCGLAADALGEVQWVKDSLDEGCRGDASAIGLPDGIAATEAALVNGVLCHALDFDDTHPAAIVHASAVIVPAALAVGEAFGRSGIEALAAMVVGNEVAIRLGMAAGTAFHSRGLHSTGVCGVFGAAAAASRLRGLDAEQTAHAFGLAASMASGTLEFLADGAQTKPLHAGWAAHGGIVAARLAAAGAHGPAAALEGERGLFATYLHGATVDLAARLADLGTTWETPNLAFKLYPVCHYIHAALDAFADTQRERALTPDDVDSIVVLADELTVALVLDPLATKRAPRTPYDAKFSLPYCIATQLVTGRLDIGSFTADAIVDTRVRRVAERITFERRDFGSPVNEMIGAVRVVMADGSVVETPPRHARGHDSRPVSVDDVTAKFRANARAAVGDEVAASIEHDLLRMARDGDLGWTSRLRRAGPGTPRAQAEGPPALSISDRGGGVRSV